MNVLRPVLLGALLTLGALSSGAAAQQRYEYSPGQWATQPAVEPGGAQEQIQHIRQMLDAGSNRAAVSKVKQFLKANSDTPLREEAMNLAGQAMMNRGLYFQAYEWYEKQLGEFPNGPLADRALDRDYTIGDAFLRGKKRVALKIFYLPAREEGVEILQRIAEHAPGTPIAEQALLRVGDYYRDRREWPEAADAYDAYVAMFPDQPDSPAATFEAAEATYRGYRGSQWDETSLIEARQRYREYARQYPLRSREQGVQDRLEQITNQRAAKAFEMADYYRRVHRPVAASYYYQQVVQYYPDTSYAQQADEQLAKLVLPPSPPPGLYGWQQPPQPPTQEVVPQPERAPAKPIRRGMDLEQISPFQERLQNDYPEMR